jgi:hypothetical protein
MHVKMFSFKIWLYMNGTIVGTPDHLKMFYENDILQATPSPDFYNLL